MKNTPNMFRVHYLIMEGNNYAGGLVERTKDVESLGGAINIKNVQKIVPLYIEFGEPITEREAGAAIQHRKDDDAKAEKQRAIKRAEEQLERAKKIVA